MRQRTAANERIIADLRAAAIAAAPAPPAPTAHDVSDAPPLLMGTSA
jgi:hypothetical protein